MSIVGASGAVVAIAKLAFTVQSAFTGLIVNVLLTSVPPQVPPTFVEYPLLGTTAKDVVAPDATFCTVLGLIEPFDPAVGVTL